MSAGEPSRLDLEVMGEIISTWDLIEATDPDISFGAMMGLVRLTCYCEAGDLSDALIWAGRMP
jgi:hypothetical protein